jgi:hypothetical protein
MKIVIWVEKEIAVSWTTGGCFPGGGTIALDLNSIFGNCLAPGKSHFTSDICQVGCSADH